MIDPALITGGAFSTSGWSLWIPLLGGIVNDGRRVQFDYDAWGAFRHMDVPWSRLDPALKAYAIAS